MSNNYVLLEKIVVGAAGASSVTFSGIPQTGYTDLVVKISGRTDRSASVSDINLTYNGSTTLFTSKIITGKGTGIGNYNGTREIGTVPAATTTSSTFGSAEFYIPNYTGLNNKSASSDYTTEGNSTTDPEMGFIASLWSNTSAINSIALTPNVGSFVANSTFYLYGVAKLGTTPAILPYATGGDTIMTDGDYWYHAFRSSGTFAPITNLSCDVLVVAGGGAGSGSAQFWSGAGGGAGGVLAHSNQSLVATNYTVTIGAGGAAGNSSDIDSGTNGSNSQFGSLTASLFGTKGGTINGPGGNQACGSSGGNIGDYRTGWWQPTAGQGFRGGYSSVAGNAAGGGGGAGSMGIDAVTQQNGGAGGAAVSTYANWGSLSAALTATGTGVSGSIAGGGGSGGSPAYGTVTQALGGGGGAGNGATIGSTNVTSGTANTGSGGGGAAGTHPSAAPPCGVGGSGGSGLVIVRYPV
jgi:hypothetical protein